MSTARGLVFSYNLSIMKKNAPLAFRIPSELKKSLQQIAGREARSISQICEILLTIGTENYGKEGSRYLHQYLGYRKDVQRGNWWQPGPARAQYTTSMAGVCAPILIAGSFGSEICITEQETRSNGVMSKPDGIAF